MLTALGFRVNGAAGAIYVKGQQSYAVDVSGPDACHDSPPFESVSSHIIDYADRRSFSFSDTESSGAKTELSSPRLFSSTESVFSVR